MRSFVFTNDFYKVGRDVQDLRDALLKCATSLAQILHILYQHWNRILLLVHKSVLVAELLLFRGFPIKTAIHGARDDPENTSSAGECETGPTSVHKKANVLGRVSFGGSRIDNYHLSFSTLDGIDS